MGWRGVVPEPEGAEGGGLLPVLVVEQVGLVPVDVPPHVHGALFLPRLPGGFTIVILRFKHFFKTLLKTK